jgi:hypothetical protein
MSRFLNQSDNNLIRSEQHVKALVRSPAQASSPTRSRPTANRADRPRLADGDIQALWPAKLSLCRRTRSWPQAISFHNRARRRAPAAWLCAKRNLSASRRVPRQLPPAPGDAQRGLRDQCRASAAPRKSRLDGSGCRNSRLRRGGRHSRQHDRILSCWRRPAVQHGRGRT